MNSQTRQVMDAYLAHPQWPAELNHVRPPFQALLSTIHHVQCVQRWLDWCGGLVSTTQIFAPGATNLQTEIPLATIDALDHHVYILHLTH